MSGNYLIKKSSGEKQHYSVEKLHKSLRLSGASDEIISNIISEVEKELSSGISTRGIYKKAFRLLRRKQHSIAARYSLKNAIMELGPTGYPFEKFIGEIFKAQGFKVNTGVILQGKCVSHEVDVVAVRKDISIVVECKYHNTPGKICNVQIPLYIHSRFNDIRTSMSVKPAFGITDFEGWVVTNTRFSGDAEQFGRCVGLHLVGWDYPRQGSLKDLVENAGLFPITAVTGLNRKQKEYLIEKNIVLCMDLFHNPGLLEPLGLNSRITDRIMSEVRELCSWSYD
ncbi:MAG: ATPase [Lentimicrobium sp.]|nr:ATPase [Lentimicrobium sp.]